MLSLPLMGVCLIGAHFLADYSLQTDYLANSKNHKKQLRGSDWRIFLAAHSSIHGLFVALITGIWFLFFLEAIAHAIIDYNKSDDKITYFEDQLFHIGCKVVWWIMAIIYYT